MYFMLIFGVLPSGRQSSDPQSSQR